MDLSALNPMQRQAAEALQGPVLILAGAGSGKTRTLTYRIANLIDHGVKPWHILALTFTNKAAREMRERVERLVGEDAQDMWLGTFHSVCVRILRRDIEKIGYKRSFTIYDDDDQLRVIKDGLKALGLDENRSQPKEMRARISGAKNKMLSPDEWFQESLKDYQCQQFHNLFSYYEERLHNANALDFDDLLLRTLQLFVEHPPVLDYYRQRFQYVLVDEYQDTNAAQYHFVRLLTEESRNLCVVGDDDQSIYGWRGADIRNILDFEKDYPDAQVVKLEQNYRSTANILDAANQVIAHNVGRKEKALWTDAGEGEKIHLYSAGDEREEAAWICERIKRLHQAKMPYAQMAVLYRNHSLSRVIEEMITRSGIPYKVFGGTRFYDRKEVRDALAYLRVLVNPADDVSLVRIINTPKRSIGDATIATLQEYAKAEELPLYSVLSDPPQSLSSRPRKCISEFAMLLMKLTALKETLPLSELVTTMLEETGLKAQFELDGNEEAQTRLENLLEFAAAAKEFETVNDEKTLEAFLENVSLVTDLDSQENAPQYVTLMTLHSAKGLEYEAVFMTGMEEGIFPSMRSQLDESKMEEERRLCYVGMTRAKKILYMSFARRRTIYNQITHNPPSVFLQEIPERLILDEWANATRNSGFSPEPAKPNITSRRDRPRNLSFGTPGMAAGGRTSVSGFGFGAGKMGLNIPGVQKGFVASPARENAQSAMKNMFRPGDHVLHRKFGEGTVQAVRGSGADARIQIAFTAYGTKEFSLSIAPIVKIDE
ncbi:MAG: UvrD-helicase domain-containing protein [Clostridia bacterium]|nr:UvrD-helicase domain-containing protein [Clostridia bacterium]